MLLFDMVPEPAMQVQANFEKAETHPRYKVTGIEPVELSDKYSEPVEHFIGLVPLDTRQKVPRELLNVLDHCLPLRKRAHGAPASQPRHGQDGCREPAIARRNACPARSPAAAEGDAAKLPVPPPTCSGRPPRRPRPAACSLPGNAGCSAACC